SKPGAVGSTRSALLAARSCARVGGLGSPCTHMGHQSMTWNPCRCSWSTSARIGPVAEAGGVRLRPAEAVLPAGVDDDGQVFQAQPALGVAGELLDPGRGEAGACSRRVVDDL